MVFSSTLGSSSHEALVKFKKHSARVALAYVWCKSWASFLIPGIPARFIFRWGYGNWGWCLKVHTSDHEWSKMATSDHERPNMTEWSRLMGHQNIWQPRFYGTLSIPPSRKFPGCSRSRTQAEQRRPSGGWKRKVPGSKVEPFAGILVTSLLRHFI